MERVVGRRVVGRHLDDALDARTLDALLRLDVCAGVEFVLIWHREDFIWNKGRRVRRMCNTRILMLLKT